MEYPYRPLYSIQRGRIGFSMWPVIGPVVLVGSREVRVAGRNEWDKPRHFEEGEIVCVYLLYYGDYVKVGTSRLVNIVARMFSQAPLLGVVVAVIQLERQLPVEWLEREVVGEAESQGVVIRSTMPSLDKLVTTWNRVIRGVSPLSEKLDLVRRERDPLEVLGAACDVAWSVSLRWGEPLYDVASHWFIPEFPEGPMPPSLPRKAAFKVGERVVLRAHPNGLFSVSTRQVTMEGGSRFTCSHNLLRRYEFEVAGSE